MHSMPLINIMENPKEIDLHPQLLRKTLNKQDSNINNTYFETSDDILLPVHHEPEPQETDLHPKLLRDFLNNKDVH
jgi:hypothetical protein